MLETIFKGKQKISSDVFTEVRKPALSSLTALLRPEENELKSHRIFVPLQCKGQVLKLWFFAQKAPEISIPLICLARLLSPVSGVGFNSGVKALPRHLGKVDALCQERLGCPPRIHASLCKSLLPKWQIVHPSLTISHKGEPIWGLLRRWKLNVFSRKERGVGTQPWSKPPRRGRRHPREVSGVSDCKPPG